MIELAYIVIGIGFLNLGTLLSLWHGGLKPLTPFGKLINKFSLEAWLLALPLVPILLAAGVYPPLALVAYALGVVGFRMGHGEWMDLGTWTKAVSSREKLSFLVNWIKDPYWKDFVGLGVSGLAPVLLACILLVCQGFFLASLALMVGGIIKVAGYALGWTIWPNNENNMATQLGEGIRGFLLFASYIAAWSLL